MGAVRQRAPTPRRRSGQGRSPSLSLADVECAKLPPAAAGESAVLTLRRLVHATGPSRSVQAAAVPVCQIGDGFRPRQAAGL